MSLSKTLAERFREVILNGKWVANTNFKDQIDTLDYETAHKTVGSLNSIAILSQHIHYYISGVKNVLEGGSLDISDKFSFDFKPMQSQEEWEAFLKRFWDDSEAFATLVESLDEKQLNLPFVDVKYSNYLRNIEGMIEHCYYHLGQVVLIKKMLLPFKQ